jgi:hypothetical protein
MHRVGHSIFLKIKPLYKKSKNQKKSKQKNKTEHGGAKKKKKNAEHLPQNTKKNT